MRAQIFRECDGVVVFGVMGAVEQRHRPARQQVRELPDRVRIFAQFLDVAFAKIIPAFRVVAEPLAQRRARRDFLEPQIDGGALLGKPARPDAIDENPRAVVPRRRLVDAFRAGFVLSFRRKSFLRTWTQSSCR